MSDCITGKVSYDRRETATRALYVARQQHARMKTVEKRVYRCEWCGSYHLTHMNPPRTRRRR